MIAHAKRWQMCLLTTLIMGLSYCTALDAQDRRPNRFRKAEEPDKPEYLSQDQFMRLLQSFQGLQGTDPDGDLLNRLMKDLQKQNDADPNQLVEQLKKNLADDKQNELMKKLSDQFQGQFKDQFGDKLPSDFQKFKDFFPKQKDPDAVEVPELPEPIEPAPKDPLDAVDPLPNDPNPDFDDFPNFQPPPRPEIDFPEWTSPDVEAQRAEQLQNIFQFWEANIGPLDDSPALRGLIADMFSGGSEMGLEFGGDFAKWLSEFEGWDLDLGSMEGLADLFSGIEWPSLGLGDTNWKLFDMSFTNNWKPGWFNNGGSWGNWGGGFGSPSFGGFGGGDGPGGLILLIIVGGLMIALLLYWRKYMADPTAAIEPRPLPGQGPWPIDPREVRDRETLVRAFEYVSVMICGENVKTWNHVRITEALADVGPELAKSALPLARLYALARYLPPEEAMAETEIAEARNHLCQLAGVPAS